MKSERSHWRETLYVIIAVVVNLSLLLALAPRVRAQAVGQAHWSDSIGEMLSSGRYVQGEAIVALPGNEGDALQAQADLPVDGLEPLMEVSAEAAGVQMGAGLSPQSSQNVTLTLVSSDALSTEEILRSLADDPRVAFAEPNYVTELCEGREGEAAQAVAAELAVDPEPTYASGPSLSRSK